MFHRQYQYNFDTTNESGTKSDEACQTPIERFEHAMTNEEIDNMLQEISEMEKRKFLRSRFQENMDKIKSRSSTKVETFSVKYSPKRLSRPANDDVERREHICKRYFELKKDDTVIRKLADSTVYYNDGTTVYTYSVVPENKKTARKRRARSAAKRKSPSKAR